MADPDSDEEPGLLQKSLDYLRGKAAASTTKKPKSTPSPDIDPDKAKQVEDSFKSVF